MTNKLLVGRSFDKPPKGSCLASHLFQNIIRAWNLAAHTPEATTSVEDYFNAFLAGDLTHARPVTEENSDKELVLTEINGFGYTEFADLDGFYAFLNFRLKAAITDRNVQVWCRPGSAGARYQLLDAHALKSIDFANIRSNLLVSVDGTYYHAAHLKAAGFHVLEDITLSKRGRGRQDLVSPIMPIFHERIKNGEVNLVLIREAEELILAYQQQLKITHSKTSLLDRSKLLPKPHPLANSIRKLHGEYKKKIQKQI